MVYTVWEVEDLTAFLKNISVWNEKKNTLILRLETLCFRGKS